MGAVSYIPLGHPFLETLAHGLIDRSQQEQIDLADMTVLLPTRRSVREITEIFLSKTKNRALILPRLRAVGDIDDQELELLTSSVTATSAHIPPSIPTWERTLVFAEMIQVRDSNLDFSRALAIAHDLENFLNEVQNESCSLDGLKNLAPLEYAEHWQKTLDFLDILRTAWPTYLQAGGMVDPAQRRSTLIQSLIALWGQVPPQTPIIAAGITGSLPDIAQLMRVIATLPQGEVILSGFDPNPWQTIADSIDPLHPQYELGRTLNLMGVVPATLRLWGNTDTLEPHTLAASQNFWNTIMLPGSESQRWRQDSAKNQIADVLKTIDIVETETLTDESNVIALYVRKVLNDAHKNAMIVTPDRSLATSIIQSCRRYGIELNDSAGTPLAQTRVGQFLDLILNLGESHMDPTTVLSFLDHPIFDHNKMPPGARANLEQKGLRHFALGADLSHHITLLQMRGCSDDAIALYQTIIQICEPLFVNTPRPVLDWITHHVRIAEHFGQADNGQTKVWHGDDGETAQTVLQTLATSVPMDRTLSLADYATLYRDMVQITRVNWRGVGHPRVKLLGVFEARLIRADHVILAGFNEQNWPGNLNPGPWLSRTMRADFGLPPVEQSVGRMALDILQWVVGADVLITRPRHQNAQPTKASRWLDRLDAVIASNRGHMGRHRNLQLLSTSHQMDTPAHTDPVRKRPMPTPDISIRPKQYSATRIEMLLHDPYHFYAQKILRLDPLLPFNTPLDARLRGSIIHRILELFVTAYPNTIPSHTDAPWPALMHQAFAEQTLCPEDQRDFAPKIQKALDRFLTLERQWRAQGARTVATEVTFKCHVNIGSSPITISAKLDRLDQLSNGTYAIIDYKTSTVLPTRKSVEERVSPQLPIQTWVTARGDATGLPQNIPVSAVGYWPITAKSPGPTWWNIDGTYTVASLLNGTGDGVQSVVATFLDSAMPFMPCPDPAQDPGYTDYHHLSRRDEWWGIDEQMGDAS